MKKGLNANQIKLIAIIAMTIDHIADILFPGFPAEPVPILLHIIGRLTAPIMWFFICEGFFYTRNLKKYLLRMFTFAVVSHFAYCFAFGINYIPFSTGELFNQTSVIWPLAWALVALWINKNGDQFKPWQKNLLLGVIYIINIPADWATIAVLAIVSMYAYRGNLEKQMKEMMIYVVIYALISFVFVNKVYGVISLFVILVYWVLKQYNGQKGKGNWMKWLFYIYYPGHLVVIGILRLLIYGNVPLLF